MFEPILVALVGLAGAFCAGFILLLVVKRAYTVEKQRILSSLHAYIEHPDENNPIAQLTGMVATQFSNIIMHHLSQTAKGLASGASRQEKAVDAAIVRDSIAANNPLIGMAIDAMPMLSKLTRKNPELVALAAEKLGPMLSKKSGDGAGAEAPNPFEFKL